MQKWLPFVILLSFPIVPFSFLSSLGFSVLLLLPFRELFSGFHDFPFCGSLHSLPLCPTPSSLLPHVRSHQNAQIIHFHSHSNADSRLSSDTLSSLGSLFFSKPLLNALLPCARIYSQLQIPFTPNLLMHVHDLYILVFFSLCLQVEIGMNYPILCYCNSRPRLDPQN